MISAIQYRIQCGSYCGFMRVPKTSYSQSPPASSSSVWWVLSFYLILINYNCHFASAPPIFSNSSPELKNLSTLYNAEPTLNINLELLQLRQFTAHLNKLCHIKFGNRNLKISHGI